MHKGDCIRVGCENLLKHRDWFFCFGNVINENGEEFTHCWNEDKEMVHDLSQGKDLHLKKEDYHKSLSIGDYTKQDIIQVATLLKQMRIYGWWIPEYMKKMNQEVKFNGKDFLMSVSEIMMKKFKDEENKLNGKIVGILY